MSYYNRYNSFTTDGDCNIVPYLDIPREVGDLYLTYDKSSMRFDRLSYEYYSDPDYAWLILLANSKYGSMEFEIKDGVTLRIPYPLNSALKRYETSIQEYNDSHK